MVSNIPHTHIDIDTFKPWIKELYEWGHLRCIKYNRFKNDKILQYDPRYYNPDCHKLAMCGMIETLGMRTPELAGMIWPAA